MEGIELKRNNNEDQKEAEGDAKMGTFFSNLLFTCLVTKEPLVRLKPVLHCGH